MADPIVIRSSNPADITPEEAEELAQIIRSLDWAIGVEVVAQQREGTGVTWAELLHISVPGLVWGGKKIVNKLADVAIEWTRKRFEGRRNGSKRPVYINIYGPDGKIVKAVAVKNATDEVQDRTEEDRRLFEQRDNPEKPK